MANEFIIKKGLSERLFQLTQEQLIENGWYLTTDTAEVYVALKQSNGLLDLRKINECNIDTDFDLETFDERLVALESEEKVHTFGYRSVFPEIGVDGHIYVAVDEQKTYVFYNNEYSIIGEVSGSAESPDVIFGGTAEE